MASKTTDLSGTQKNDVTTMQGVNSIICSQTPANNDTVYFLIDDRINYTSNTKFSYRIKKLTDAYTDSNGKQQTGHCWMNQNLAIQGQTTLTPTYSNLPHSNVGASYTLPVSDSSASRWNASANFHIESMFNGSHVDNAIDQTEDVTGTTSNTGARYTWQTLSSGTGNLITVDKRNLAYDICPAGWRLPKAYTDAGTLTEMFSLSTNWGTFSTPFNVIDTDNSLGHCTSDGCYHGNTHYWTSTFSADNCTYTSPAASDGSANRCAYSMIGAPSAAGGSRGSWGTYYGFSARCVAK